MAKFNIRESFKSQKFKYGGYSTLMTAIVLAIVIIVNLVVGMDRVNKSIDLTQNKLFSLSSESKQILKKVNQKVTIVGLYEQGKDAGFISQIKQILKQYQSASSNIDLQYVDPELHPGYVTKYKDAKNITTNSIVVECGTKYKVLAQSDLFEYDYSNYNPYDTSSQPQVTSVVAEQKLTSAILYVTSDKNPTIYTLQGHEEGALSQSYTQYFADENYTLKDVSLLNEELKTQSGDILLINSPQKDLSDMEFNKIKDYLAGGGRAMFLMGLSEKELPNFKKLLNLYGVDVNRAIVLEGDNNHIYQSPVNILPNLGSHEITNPISSSKMNVIISGAMPIKQVSVKKDTLKIESLLSTSDKAYGRVDLTKNVIEKQADDIKGPFDVAVAVTDAVDQSNTDKNAKLVVFSSPTIIDEQLMQLSNGANIDIFLNSMNWLAEKKDSLVIRPKSLAVESLDMTQSQSLTVAAIAVIFIPGVVAVAGICVWLRRRHL